MEERTFGIELVSFRSVTVGMEYFVSCPFKTLEEFEDAALFLRLGLPSRLIHHENEAFRKRSSNGTNLKTPTLPYSVERKHFEN